MEATHEIIGYDAVEMGGIDDEIYNKLLIKLRKNSIFKLP
jgi:hypothetical protein